jgi:hypothetical protein
MKKFLCYFVACTLFIFYSGLSFGQCTPDPLVTDPEGNGEMVPDTIEVVENVPFNITLTIIAPDSATIPVLGKLALHHITLNNLQNKPSWLSYSCNPSSCEFVGNASRCALVTGTPPLGSAGYHPIAVLVDVYTSILSFPVCITCDSFPNGYDSGLPMIVLVHPQGWSITEHINKGFGIMEAQPNPYNKTVKVGCYTETAQNVRLRIVDMVGHEVYSEKLSTNAGDNFFQFNGSDLSNGIYFYSVIDAQGRVITKKMIKS